MVLHRKNDMDVDLRIGGHDYKLFWCTIPTGSPFGADLVAINL